MDDGCILNDLLTFWVAVVFVSTSFWTCKNMPRAFNTPEHVMKIETDTFFRPAQKQWANYNISIHHIQWFSKA